MTTMTPEEYVKKVERNLLRTTKIVMDLNQIPEMGSAKSLLVAGGLPKMLRDELDKLLTNPRGGE